MKAITSILCWFTLFLDICLALGCLSSRFFVMGYAVVGPLTSKTPEGMTTIIIVTVWTGALAICGLLASKQSK